MHQDPFRILEQPPRKNPEVRNQLWCIRANFNTGLLVDKPACNTMTVRIGRSILRYLDISLFVDVYRGNKIFCNGRFFLLNKSEDRLAPTSFYPEPAFLT